VSRLPHRSELGTTEAPIDTSPHTAAASRALVRAILREDPTRNPDRPHSHDPTHTHDPTHSDELTSWALVGDRAHDPDLVSRSEYPALPFLYDHWQRLGHDVGHLTIMRGLRRRMIVSNRLLLDGARTALGRLHEAGIDAVAIKGTGLIGRLLPSSGLRAFADIDLWVRPSQHARAAKVLGSTGRVDGLRTHAKMTRDRHRREIDLHIVPSHLFVRRRISADAAEAQFERAWQRRTEDGLADADLLYYSFLNTLLSDGPGSPRCAFALIELHTVLRDLPPGVSDAVLRDVVAHAVEDRTVTVFVEHLDWLGTGASGPLDRLLRDRLEPALTARDQEVRTELEALRSVRGVWSHPVLHQTARHLAHAHGSGSLGPWTVMRAIVGGLARALRHHPRLLIAWPLRRRNWTLLGQVVTTLLRPPTSSPSGSPAR